jgi:hypothetical protein
MNLLGRLSAPRRFGLSLALLCLLYFLSRAGNLQRELVSEESVFLMPGRSLFEGSGFRWQWGEVAPDANPFHKPPLTSLLLGAFSLLTPDGVAGAKLLPFLIGFFVCLFPFLVTRSVVPSLLILASPFFYGAASHMQTDPTVGLLGYTLVCWGILTAGNGARAPTYALLVSGMAVLWLGKLEIAVMASLLLILCMLLPPPNRRALLLKASVVATLLGILLLVGISWSLGRTTNRSLRNSLGRTYETVVGVTTATLEQHAAQEGAGARSRSSLLQFAARFEVTHLFFLCLAPSLAVLLFYRRLWSLRQPYLPLLAAALIPVAVYFYVAYSGDGYPRYFLIVFPPLCALLGLCLRELAPPWRRAVSAVIVLAGFAVMAPDTLAMMDSPGSPTVDRGVFGARAAAQALAALTKPGDLVMGPECATYYLPDRRWLVEESFAPYPGLHWRALRLAPELRAAIVRRDPATALPDVVAQMISSLEQRGAFVFRSGSFQVIVEKPRPPQRQ